MKSDLIRQDYETRKMLSKEASAIFEQMHGVAGYAVIDSIIKMYNDFNALMKTTKPRSMLPNVATLKTTGKTRALSLMYKLKLSLNSKRYTFSDLVKTHNITFTLNVIDLCVADANVSDVIEERISNGYYNYSDEDFVTIDKVFRKPFYNVMGATVYAVNGVISPRGFYSAFFHEFNHLFMDYIQRIRKSYREYFVTHTNNLASKEINSMNMLDNHKKVINDIFYLLFNDNEIHAYSAGLFGELLGANIKRNEYNNFRHNDSVIWRDVYALRDHIDAIKEISDEKFFESIYNALKTSKYNIVGDTFDYKSFKSILITKLNNKIQKFLLQLNKAADLYFMHIDSTQHEKITNSKNTNDSRNI